MYRHECQSLHQRSPLLDRAGNSAGREDTSRFPYKDQLELVRKGTADILKLTVHSGSEYIISRATFLCYFIKKTSVINECYTEIDLKIFRTFVAPALGITHRFVGTESCGAIGGHCDTAAGSALSIIVALLVRGHIPTLVDHLIACVTPGSSVDILVIDHGIAVNPARPELADRLKEAGIKGVPIEWLRERAQTLTGQPCMIRVYEPSHWRCALP